MSLKRAITELTTLGSLTERELSILTLGVEIGADMEQMLGRPPRPGPCMALSPLLLSGVSRVFCTLRGGHAGGHEANGMAWTEEADDG